MNTHAKGALIGAIIGGIIAFIWNNFWVICTSFFFLIITGVILTPFWNEDANYDQMKEAVEFGLKYDLEYDAKDPRTINAVIKNGSRYDMLNVRMKCDNSLGANLPSVNGGETASASWSFDFKPKDCDFTYEVKDRRQLRDGERIQSSNVF